MPHRSGFTLIEIAVVLVLLGLVVGGILAGQSLIRSSQLRSVINEFHRYVTATQSFREQYSGLPGDLRNATAYWGVADPGPTTCRYAITADTSTCNGNGNGIIGDALPAANENFAFWKQLANAELILGTYDGSGSPSAAYLTPSPRNTPTAKIGNSGLWGVFHPSSGYITGGNYFQGPDYGNFLMLTREFGGGSNNQIGLGLITPEEAYYIDGKMDDARPGLGKVVSNYTNCSTGGANNSDITNANYNLTNKNTICMLFFPQSF